jgi:hypothetical protein
MHSILWASILASAGVALVTTLLVEYLAKPGLEARKDRIIENRREWRVRFDMSLPKEEVQRRLDPAADKLGLFHDYFTVPKWNLKRRRKLITLINSSPLPDIRVKSTKEDNSLPD